MAELNKDHRTSNAVVNSDGMQLSLGFIRQRRNLIVSSMALILIALADATIGDKINLFFITIEVHNKKAFEYFPLVLCIYFFWRYGQYLYQEEKISFFNIYSKYFQRYTDNIFNKILSDMICEERSLKNVSNLNFYHPNIHPIRYPFQETKFGYTEYVKEELSEKVIAVDLPFYKRLLHAKCIGYRDEQERLIQLVEINPDNPPIYVKKEINLFCYPWQHIRALYEAMFSTSYFTDYWLPTLMGVVAIAVYYYHLFLAPSAS